MRARDGVNRKRFLFWLKSKKPEEIIGFSGIKKDSPIEMFARQEGLSEASIMCNSIWFPHGIEGSWDPLPKWARVFLGQLESVAEAKEIEELHVTANQALSLIENNTFPIAS